MGRIPERVRDMMKSLSGREEPENDTPVSPKKTQKKQIVQRSSEREEAEKQKEKALARIKSRSVSRPVKKSAEEKRPGRGKTPPSQRETHTLVSEKVTEKDIYEDDFQNFDDLNDVQEKSLPTTPLVFPQEKVPPIKGLSSLVQRLRGISQGRKKDEESDTQERFDDLDEAEDFSSTEDLFTEDSSNFVIHEPDNAPDETVATALSVAVGIIYWDDENMLVDRVITIRRLFRRSGDILIDAFCHDLGAPRLVFFSRVVRLYDLRTMQAFDDPKTFLLNRIVGISSLKGGKTASYITALSEIRYDLAALAFVARADSEKSDVENQIIYKYVEERCAGIPFDTEEMKEYVSMLYPDEQSFYEAVDVIIKQPHNVLYPFVETFLQLILSDGVIHDNERELLAELLYILRLEGIELNILGLK